MAQIYKDAEFFKRCKIIDYSLLLGLHEIQPGEKFDKVNKKAPFS